MMALKLVSLLGAVAMASPVSAAPHPKSKDWQSQWHWDANGVVDYGYNTTFGKGYDNATQIRIAYRGCNGMSVSFSTNDRQETPQVKYGTSNSSLHNTAYSPVSITYATSPKYENHVVLEDLDSDTTYYYSICDGPVQSFKTARCAGDMTPYSAAVVVDLGTMGPYGLVPSASDNKTELNTIQRLVAQADDYEFVMQPGDFAYADYWVKEELNGASNLTIQDQVLAYNVINEAFFNELSAVASKKAFMVGVGNHEANCDNGGTGPYTETLCVAGMTNFTQYKARWNMPGDGSASNNFWYSFDVGMTHYVVFDTETDLPAPYYGGDVRGGHDGMFEANVGAYPNAQVDFINRDLAAVDRKKTPWVVALGHRPWYSATAPANLFTEGIHVFEPIFTKYNVDVVMQGHNHILTRTFPVWQNGTVQQTNYDEPKAPVYLVNGAAGHWSGLDPVHTPYPSWVAFANNTEYSYSKLTFHNSTHLTHAFMASADNHVIDEITIVKTH